MSEIKELKRFIYSATVTSGSGSQSFYIDAKSREEADARAANNESNGMYADDSEVTDLDALEYEDETTVDDFGDFPLISREQSLIAQLESAQKERDVYAKLASDVGDIITLLQNNEWAEHIGKTNVGGLLEYQITRLMNSIADINTKLLAAEAALSAANERLKGEPVPVAYFAAAPDYGWDMFNNKEDAIATCQAEIDAYRECRDDGWDDDVQRVCWGIVIQKAEGFDHQGVHTSNSHHTYQTCDYSLRPVVVEGNADAE
ncbi:hypothetical protein FG446_002124 [Yersinia enterocolitica]|nr:hypothetical protein [Yersinia enterocolitica]EKN4845769.1 hypothetical protein [Yersinia enterocolitica]